MEFCQTQKGGEKAITTFFLLRIIMWNVPSGVATLLSTQLWSTAARHWLTTWWMLCTRSIGRTSKLKGYVIWKHKCSWSSGDPYESTSLMWLLGITTLPSLPDFIFLYIMSRSIMSRYIPYIMSRSILKGNIEKWYFKFNYFKII